MKCLKKIDMKQFYDLLDEDIDYHTGGTAAFHQGKDIGGDYNNG